jgi:hypothetical protein
MRSCHELGLAWLKLRVEYLKGGQGFGQSYVRRWIIWEIKYVESTILWFVYPFNFH